MTRMKILVIWILLTVLLLIPISSAVDVNADIDNESNETPESPPTDNNVEIISFFRGSCESVNTIGLVVNEPIDIYTGDFALDINGWKKPVSGLFDIFFHVTPLYVKASRFIGFVYEFQAEELYNVWGIALGNIEWS